MTSSTPTAVPNPSHVLAQASTVGDCQWSLGRGRWVGDQEPSWRGSQVVEVEAHSMFIGLDLKSTNAKIK